MFGWFRVICISTSRHLYLSSFSTDLIATGCRLRVSAFVSQTNYQIYSPEGSLSDDLDHSVTGLPALSHSLRWWLQIAPTGPDDLQFARCRLHIILLLKFSGNGISASDIFYFFFVKIEYNFKRKILFNKLPSKILRLCE